MLLTNRPFTVARGASRSREAQRGRRRAVAAASQVGVRLSPPNAGPAGTVEVRAAAKRDAKQRIVITGMGITSCHGNDPDVFYSKCAGPPHVRNPAVFGAEARGTATAASAAGQSDLHLSG